MSEDLSSAIELDEDLSKAEAPDPLPINRKYRATIREANPARSARTDNKYVDVVFVIPETEYPSDYTDGDADGVVLHYRRVPWADVNAGEKLSKSERYRLRLFSEAIGAPMGRTVELDKWIGCEALLSLKIQTFEDVPRNEIDRVERAS